MLSIRKLIKPFPKKLKIRETDNIGCYFNYKKYASIQKVCENLLSLNDENLFEGLRIFSKNHYKYRDTLYYNLQTVSIGKLTKKDCAGIYSLSDEENELSYTGLNALYHELLHLSSSQFDKINLTLYSGFGYNDCRERKIVGEGITEGYIELLCDRGLHNGKFVNDIKDERYYVCYCYTKALVRQLEIVVGKELLEDMFFKDGFRRLKEFLLQYKSENEVNKFFHNCDISTIAHDYNNPILNKKTLDAQAFLLDIINSYMPEKKDLIKNERLLVVGKLKKHLMTGVMQYELDENSNSKSR